MTQMELPRLASACAMLEEFARFAEYGRTRVSSTADGVPAFANEFWTSRQRAAHRLHEISYRACFKPQLPRFFIERLTAPGEIVYDPFMGRGTTPLEAALCGRVPFGSDLNPICTLLVRPRLAPPAWSEVEERLGRIDLERTDLEVPEELHVFYHPRTLRQICALRAYLLDREAEGLRDPVDDWIRMIALNRMTGHSPGFFSVYTLPPNQATSVTAQKRINAKRGQAPPFRDVQAIITKKSRLLLKDPPPDPEMAGRARLMTRSAERVPEIADGSVSLVVTSPPFLNTVDYAEDNWLRGWFCDQNTKELKLAVTGSLPQWRAFMTRAFREMRRVVKPGGWIAFEVGEVRKGRLFLENEARAAAADAGMEPTAILINEQKFTKTSQCWGVENFQKGTNTNRIVLFQV